MKKKNIDSLVSMLKSKAGKSLPLFYKALERRPKSKHFPRTINNNICNGEMFARNNFYKPISRPIKTFNSQDDKKR